MEYKFFGNQAKCVATSPEYPRVTSVRDMYDLMLGVWCEYSCAPRYRAEWSKENPTLGQCSITSFLVQDIFGGRVFGVPLGDGSFHCYNVVGDEVFDLTSEQFGDKKLAYDLENEQFRDVHFSSAEKRERYEYICRELKKAMQ